MSIVCLTSNGQDPAEWNNYFSESLELPPNSELCLIGSSLEFAKRQNENIVITDDNNTFVLHYGGNGNLYRDNCFSDDIITIPSQVYEPQAFAGALQAALNTQVSNSCLAVDAWEVSINNLLTTLTIKARLMYCEDEKCGEWVAVGLNQIDDLTVVKANDETTTTFNFQQAASQRCWYVNQTPLFNNWNQGRTNDFANNMEGVSFSFNVPANIATNQEQLNGMAGGIITGSTLNPQLGHAPRINWRNIAFNAQDVNSTSLNNIDIGFEIEGTNINFFYHSISPTNANGASGIEGRTKNMIGTVALQAGTTQQIMIRTVINPDAPENNFNDLPQLECIQRTIGNAWAAVDTVALTSSSGDFALGKYIKQGWYSCLSFAKGNNKDVEFSGTHMEDAIPVADDDGYNEDYFRPLNFGFRKVNPQSIQVDEVNLQFVKTIEQYANISQTLGFNDSIEETKTSWETGIEADNLLENYSPPQSAVAVQFLDMGINGFLAGSDNLGGTHQCPLVGIVDGFQTINRVPMPSPKVWELTNNNWIRLNNASAISLNQMRVRLTDLTGKRIMNLLPDSSVWFKIRRAPKSASSFKLPGDALNGNQPTDWLEQLHS